MNIYQHKEDGQLYILYSCHPGKNFEDIQAWKFDPWNLDKPFMWTITPIIRKDVRYKQKLEDYELKYER